MQSAARTLRYQPIGANAALYAQPSENTTEQIANALRGLL